MGPSCVCRVLDLGHACTHSNSGWQAADLWMTHKPVVATTLTSNQTTSMSYHASTFLLSGALLTTQPVLHLLSPLVWTVLPMNTQLQAGTRQMWVYSAYCLHPPPFLLWIAVPKLGVPDYKSSFPALFVVDTSAKSGLLTFLAQFTALPFATQLWQVCSIACRMTPKAASSGRDMRQPGSRQSSSGWPCRSKPG